MIPRKMPLDELKVVAALMSRYYPELRQNPYLLLKAMDGAVKRKEKEDEVEKEPVPRLRLLTVKQVTECLSCSRMTLYRLLRAGQIKCVRFGTSHIRIRSDVLEQLILNMEQIDYPPRKIRVGKWGGEQE